MPIQRVNAQIRLFSSPTFGLSLVELLVVILILSLLLTMLFPAIQMVRASSQRANCANKLRQIALAGIDFESFRGKFEMEGWGKDYAPFFELNDFVGNVFPEDQLKDKTIPLLICPSDELQGARPSGILTNYLGCLGSRYYQDGTTDGIFAAPENFETPSNRVGSADVTDGLDHTVFFSELLVGSVEVSPIKRATWLVPGSYLEDDYDDFLAVADSIPSEDSVLMPIGSRGYGFLYFPAQPGTSSENFQVTALAASPGDSVYSHALTPQRPSLQIANGSPSYSAYPASSNHNVVNLAYASGATGSYTSIVDPIVWRAISTRAGQELNH